MRLCFRRVAHAAGEADPMSIRWVRTCWRGSSARRSKHFWAAAVSLPRATARICGCAGSLRSVQSVTESRCRFFRLSSSRPMSVITRRGSIRRSSDNWYSTIRSTVSAAIPRRRATSSAVLPINDRSTNCSKREVEAVSCRLNGGMRCWRCSRTGHRGGTGPGRSRSWAGPRHRGRGRPEEWS